MRKYRKARKPKKVPIGISFDPKDYETLRELATDHNRSVSNMLQMFIREFLGRDPGLIAQALYDAETRSIAAKVNATNKDWTADLEEG